MRSPSEIARERARLEAVIGAKMKADGTATSIKGFCDRFEARAVHDAHNKKRKLDEKEKKLSRGTVKITKFAKRRVGVQSPHACCHGAGPECPACKQARKEGVLVLDEGTFIQL